jgi:hypothetical protein
MTRLEWFNLQPKYIQDRFKENCSENNSDHTDFFDWWSGNNKQLKFNDGLMGAFTFKDSPEGHAFWYDIHTQAKEFTKYIKIID